MAILIPNFTKYKVRLLEGKPLINKMHVLDLCIFTFRISLVFALKKYSFKSNKRQDKDIGAKMVHTLLS